MTDTTLQELADFPRRLAAHYAAIPPGHAQWRPATWDGIPSERFAPLAQLCHLRDIEIDGYRVRFARTLGEERPLLADIDSDALALARDYASCDDAAGVLAAFAEARAGTVRMLSTLSAADFARVADFEGLGPITVRGLVHQLCSHDAQHLAGLQWLASRIDADRFASMP
ncbi:MAG: DinB family protein [Lysobacter sp.]|nr:DinB family protein [Lysobacter sp.]